MPVICTTDRPGSGGRVLQRGHKCATHTPGGGRHSGAALTWFRPSACQPVPPCYDALATRGLLGPPRRADPNFYARCEQSHPPNTDTPFARSTYGTFADWSRRGFVRKQSLSTAGLIRLSPKTDQHPQVLGTIRATTSLSDVRPHPAASAWRAGNSDRSSRPSPARSALPEDGRGGRA